MSHAPQAATLSIEPSTVIDQEGNQHRLIEVMLISIRRPTTQEGVQEGLQEGVA